MKGIRFLPLAMAVAAVTFAADQPPGAADISTEDGPCEAIDRFAVSRMQIPPGDVQDLKNQVHFRCRLPKNLALNFLIATVPDPIETHLALWFDRAVESILSAAGSVGFRFYEAWIPWDTDLVRDEPDVGKRKLLQAERRRREKQPGVLLFRSSVPCTQAAQSCQSTDLVVLLVPETPTGGIQPEVFADATEMIFWASSSMNHASAGVRKIPVMGPSFSGSFASLAKIMQHGPGIKDRLQVISGTAGSSEAWREAFDKSQSQYSTTVHSIDTQFRILRDHMLDEWRKGSRLALLTETETGLGWFYTTAKIYRPGDDPLIFRYPREISRLRNAYGDEELKAVVGAQPQSVSFRNLLTFRLFDTGSGTDSTPVLARNQTPLSQDAVLEEIAESLERERVTLAGILATDVFDGLFIARYLRDACPDVRLFTFDSDLLYERAAQDFPFEGTLALGTYPLIAPNQAWTGMHQKRQGDNGQAYDRPERLSFPSRGSEGIYNATRALLIRANFVSKDYGNEPLAEYFNPTVNCAGPEQFTSRSEQFTGCYAPPVWLTVLGRGGYWPLAVMDTPSGVTQKLAGAMQNGLLLAWPSAGNVSRFGLGSTPRVWRVFFVLIVLGLGWHFVRNCMACMTRFGRVRGFSHLNVWPDEEGWLARLCYLHVCSFALFALYALFIAPLIAITRTDPAGSRWSVWIAELLLGMFAVLGASPLLALLRKRAKPSAPVKLMWPETWHFGILGVAVLFSGFFIWALLRLYVSPVDPSGNPFDHQEAFFFAYRSLHLTSGVSPLAPLLLLLPAYFAWGRVHLRRVAMLHERLVDVPPLGDTSKGEGGEARALAECRDAIDPLVNEPLPFHWRTAGAFVLVLAISLYMTHPLRSFEYAPFDNVFVLMLTVLYALLFLTWTRFLLIWRQFRVFLEQLERLPLRFAFDELPKKRVISPLFQFTAWHAEFTMFVAIRERLARLKLKLTQQQSLDSTSSDAIGDLDREIGGILTSVTTGLRISRNDAGNLRLSLEKVNKILLNDLHRGLWKSGRSERGGDEPRNEEEAVLDGLREEVIALQYHDYIQYILHQQRNLLLFALTAFTLSILALHAYPFRGHGALRRLPPSYSSPLRAEPSPCWRRRSAIPS